MPKINLKQIATLAQIPLTEKEIKTLEPQLINILNFVEQVSKAPAVSQVKNTRVTIIAELRKDEANSERSLSAKDALSNSSSHDGSQFVVKGVFE